jgi:chromosome segregation ATPase
MGKKPSQNITYTSSADKIATLENPTSRARVAQERLNKRKNLSEEEKTQLNQIIDQANVEIQAKEELKAQKTELANEYKRLDKKRSETPYRETKKEITKQMDKISDEFDKLTYEEQGQFAKPKEVEAEEIKEAEKIEEERQNLDMNETPQIDEKPQVVSSEKVAE